MSARAKFVRNVCFGAALLLGPIASMPYLAAHAAAPASHHVVDTPWGTSGDRAKVTRTVTIIATEIKFNVTHLTFKKGETVKFVFVNKGEQAHEFMIADAAEQAEHRKMMSDMAGANMQAANHADEGNVVDAKPNETKELVWRFTKKGKFQFACNYIGHAEAGMIGTIDVR
ncbi:MAG: cupredoxin domain-containing protein [Proteobacteria bacterium]|nr:cupredoxin domain-containing protein [Pseudomonadota bacterium]